MKTYRTSHKPLLAGLLALALLSVLACGGHGLRLTHIRSAHEKPSNVAVYFKVETSDGEPIGGLTADKFVIYEDDTVVSQFESKQTIINPEAAASHYTLLLVDMSGSISESGSSKEVVDAATAFTENVEKYQKVGVYAFDGSEDLHPISPFTSSAGSATARVKSLESFRAKDTSTNLNGAVVKGLGELDRALATAEHPMRFGTLVVFTDGTDRAARVTSKDMYKAIGDSKYDVFAIGLGAEIKQEEIHDIGKNGTAMAQDRGSVVQAFDTIAKRIQDLTRSYYLLSYCSPARAGKHEVRIEAIVKDKDNERRGSLTTEFDATGFGPNCDPNKLPNFDIRSGDAANPEYEGAGKKPASSPVQAGGSVTLGTKPASQPKASPSDAPKSPSGEFNP